jgi:hydroxylamine reductase
MAGWPGVPHIADRPKGGKKDFSAIIALAKKCPPPTEIETGKIVGGFAHNQVLALADKVIAAVKSGAIKRFVVMAGCDGRQKARSYFTDVAEALPKDTVILTAGCAKYRYNKLNLGDIGGIPRVLDAGQCNDSYSLAVIALKLKEVFGLDDVNKLPLSLDIAWYEQRPSPFCWPCLPSASRVCASDRPCPRSSHRTWPKCSWKTSTSNPSAKSRPTSPP